MITELDKLELFKNIIWNHYRAQLASQREASREHQEKITQDLLESQRRSDALRIEKVRSLRKREARVRSALADREIQLREMQSQDELFTQFLADVRAALAGWSRTEDYRRFVREKTAGHAIRRVEGSQAYRDLLTLFPGAEWVPSQEEGLLCLSPEEGLYIDLRVDTLIREKMSQLGQIFYREMEK